MTPTTGRNPDFGDTYILQKAAAWHLVVAGAGGQRERPRGPRLLLLLRRRGGARGGLAGRGAQSGLLLLGPPLRAQPRAPLPYPGGVLSGPEADQKVQAAGV